MEPAEEPIISEVSHDSAEYKDYLNAMAGIEKDVDVYKHTQAAKLVSGLMENAGGYLLMAQKSITSTDERMKGVSFGLMARKQGLESEVAVVCMRRIKDFAKDKTNDPVFGPWLRFTALPADQFAEKGPALAAELANSPDVNPVIAQALAAKAPKSLEEVAAVYTDTLGQLARQLNLPKYVRLGGGGKKTIFDLAKTETVLPEPMDALRRQMFAPDSLMMPDEKLMTGALGVQFTNPQTTIRAKGSSIDFSHPGAPVRAMVLVDKPQPKDSAVFIRGEPTNRGAIAPRKFLTVLSYGKDEPFKDGSGRLELARDIADRDNPLTARVIVNRVWQWHFGQAIVRTVNDFGTRSEPPTHPELLDWMATWLMDNGWSLKKLQKLILLSSTYQQSSVANDRGMREDPTNQWLWRANIQRLDFESIRDTFLTIGGKLDRDVNGRPFIVATSATTGKYKGMVTNAMLPKTSTDRRTIYAMIDRNALPDMFGTFDFANPEMTTGERLLTTVPQQALFMMNSPFVVEQVKNLLARPDFPKDGVDEDKVRFIFRTALQRQPTAAELVLARNFLSDDPPDLPDPVAEPQANDDTKTRAQKTLALKALQPSKQLNVWERYTQAVLEMNELIFLN
jgi:hypothetical protein